MRVSCCPDRDMIIAEAKNSFKKAVLAGESFFITRPLQDKIVVIHYIIRNQYGNWNR